MDQRVTVREVFKKLRECSEGHLWASPRAAGKLEQRKGFKEPRVRFQSYFNARLTD